MTTFERWKNIMKCVPLEEKRLAKWAPPYIVQPKYDGDRCRAVKLHSGNFILLSSEENLILGTPHINDYLNSISSNLPNEIDAELYNHQIHKEGGHELIHSIVSRSVNLHSRHKEMQLHVFDLVNKDIQVQRIVDVKNLPVKDPIIISPFKICYNLDDVTRYYDELVLAGYEGIIVRNIENFYEVKRSSLVMKFKPKQQDEYEIVGCQEEVSINGMPKDTLGVLICKSGDGNTFKVGTGFTDERRKELWEAKSLIIGQKAIVKYQHLTTGKQVPRFPVFVEVKWET